VVFYPLVIGAPWLYADDYVLPGAEWHSFDFFRVFVEEIDEFSRVREIKKPEAWHVMREISERAFKTCMTEILGDELSKDWGGETSDHFTPHVNLGGRRVPAAFLLKGPSQWGPMKLNSLGKNNDQIVRLSKEPAQLLVVQHCHEITAPVHDTLRAFAVQPGSQRRYCLIDGRDSLWLLTAYDKLDRALELTRTEKAG
jgi:hypothetical protein